MVDLTNSIREYRVVVILSGLGLLSLVIDAIKKLTTASDAVDWLVKHGVHSNGAQVQPFVWFDALVLLVLAVFIVVAGMCWKVSADLKKRKIELTATQERLTATETQLSATETQLSATQTQLTTAQRELSTAQTTHNEITASALRTLHGMVDATMLIRQHLIPAAESPFNIFTLIKSRYLIEKDFTTTVESEYHMRASDQPIHFWEFEFGAEPEAEPVSYLLDIDFSVKDSSNRGQLVYLPSSKHTHTKKVVLYFLPFIRPDEEEPRIIKIRYRWKGYFRHLQTFSEELVQAPLMAKGPINLIQYEVFLEPGTGKKLVCEVSGSRSGKQQMGPAHWSPQPNQLRWEGYQYRIEGGNPGTYGMQLRLEPA